LRGNGKDLQYQSSGRSVGKGGNQLPKEEKVLNGRSSSWALEREEIVKKERAQACPGELRWKKRPHAVRPPVEHSCKTRETNTRPGHEQKKSIQKKSLQKEELFPHTPGKEESSLAAGAVQVDEKNPWGGGWDK